jgi:hypothetical protein
VSREASAAKAQTEVAPEDTPQETPAGPPPSFIRAYGRAIFFCALLLFLCGTPGAGFSVILYGIIGLIYLGVRASAADDDPPLRRRRLNKLFAWLGCIAFIIALHQVYGWLARANAERAVAQVQAFKQHHDRWPADAREAGLEQSNGWVARSFYYRSTDGNIHWVSYHDPWCAFVLRYFDLDAGRWESEAM